MIENQKYGRLLTPDIKLHRQQFRELLKLYGIYVLFRAPKADKHWTTYAEIENNFEQPILVGCLFHEHPTQQTMKKLGWNAELQESASLIDVDYDLEGLQVGALVIVPSGIDNAKGRLFRVVRMENSIVYPSCVTCMIVPEYEDKFVPETGYDTAHNSFPLIDEEEDTLFTSCLSYDD